MKKASITWTSIFVLVFVLGLLSFKSFNLKIISVAYGIETKKLQNKGTANVNPTGTMFDKPWSNLSVNYANIVIYPDRVEPNSTLTFTYTFGNAIMPSKRK